MTESIAEISKNQKIIFNNEFIDKIIVDIEAANNLEIKSSFSSSFTLRGDTFLIFIIVLN